MQLFKRLLKDESGATAVEYSLLCALIAIAIITAATSLGNELNDTFNEIQSELSKANSA